MRSAELARLAGVSVRTLRHYHQTGILAEPDRHANGYRSYSVHDLVRVLRIRRLAALGIPLDQMPVLLDDRSADTAGALDALDEELATQIDRLTAQRRVIARLREHGASPDIPPELAPFVTAFTGLAAHPQMAEHDRDQTILLAHLAGEEGIPHIARFYEGISAPDVAPAAGRLAVRFAELSESSTDAQIAELVDDFVDVMGPVLDELTPHSDALDLRDSAQLMNEYTDGALNDAQRQCMALLETALAAR